MSKHCSHNYFPQQACLVSRKWIEWSAMPHIELKLANQFVFLIYMLLLLRNLASNFHWLSSSIFNVRCSLFVPHPWHFLSSPLYDVSDHTNHIFSVRIWSWQHVSVIHFWVEPSLPLSSYSLLEVRGSRLLSAMFRELKSTKKPKAIKQMKIQGKKDWQCHKTKQMQPMWLCLFSGKQFKDTFEIAQSEWWSSSYHHQLMASQILHTWPYPRLDYCIATVQSEKKS